MNTLNKEIALVQMNIHNFAKYPTERRGIGLACSNSIHNLACLSVGQQSFPLSKEFPFSNTVYNCEAIQSLATKSTIVTESTKSGLIAYRQVLRKASFNYSKCCSSPMAEATSIEFSHIIQQCLTFKTIL